MSNGEISLLQQGVELDWVGLSVKSAPCYTARARAASGGNAGERKSVCEDQPESDHSLQKKKIVLQRFPKYLLMA
jgi:hypothetical protein